MFKTQIYRYTLHQNDSSANFRPLESRSHLSWEAGRQKYGQTKNCFWVEGNSDFQTSLFHPESLICLRGKQKTKCTQKVINMHVISTKKQAIVKKASRNSCPT